jgi:transcriptional regulator GlxA family with amidase domain
MHDASDEPLRLAELARDACLSDQQFARVFRAAYGATPGRYLAGLRIERAKRLLAADVSVTEVCMAVGYTSLGTFSRRFAEETSLSPRAFQRQLRTLGAVPARLTALFVPTCFLALYAPAAANVDFGEVRGAAGR